jgi:hypothetical protein
MAATTDSRHWRELLTLDGEGAAALDFLADKRNAQWSAREL